jgi:hypothetical protein
MILDGHKAYGSWLPEHLHLYTCSQILLRRGRLAASHPIDECKSALRGELEEAHGGTERHCK